MLSEPEDLKGSSELLVSVGDGSAVGSYVKVGEYDGTVVVVHIFAIEIKTMTIIFTIFVKRLNAVTALPLANVISFGSMSFRAITCMVLFSYSITYTWS
mmetsp:Transcript_40722/g.47635  ORF Transcript_40722/g.47635 Transcript_40722/m.47635 type:complete len:99 (-) Transcript_40722:30-326(-)